MDSVNDLPSGLSKPAQRALSNAGISSLKELSGFTEKEISKLHGIGPDAMKKIRTEFERQNLSFSKST